ncbi:MAG: glycosyltransferase, partial [Bacteroidota bacterium]
VAISLGEGGADRSCALLSRMLDEQGFEVHIAILTDLVNFPYAGTLLNLGALKLEKDSFLRRFLRLRKLKRYLKEEGIDLVIDHRPKNNYQRELFYRNYVYKGLSTVYVVHSFQLATYFGTDPQQFKKLYTPNTTTVVVSEGIKEKLDTELQLPKVEVVYNAFDASWNLQAQQASQVKDGSYLLSYGRLDDDVKDLSFLLESYHHSRLWEQGCSLVLMGEGKDEYKLKSKAKDLSITEHVQFLPYTSNPFPVIANAHAVCLTSHWEGFPMVLVESLSLGIPVVSLDIETGPSEIVQHRKNGLLVSERRVAAFAGAIGEMYTDRELHENCKAHAKPSVSKFSMTAVGEAWRKLLTNA